MTIVTIHQAKTNLSKLLAMVEAGEEVVIARGKESIAQIIPLKKMGKRQAGTLKGLVSAEDASAFAPMSDEELDEWGLL
jgi:antitoxin (DNA-binding transcriptional repressor) of toxin-antitoxin stability system